MGETAVDRPHRILAFDPGATRTGWAVIDEGPTYIASGVVHTPRPQTEAFQKYRMRLTKEWALRAIDLILKWWPTNIVSETVPSRGAGIPEQLYLANVQITTVHAIGFRYGLSIEQVSARTVQKEIAIRGKSKGVTKPQVRNGVLDRLPQLKPRFKEFVKVFEETDAIAVGLHCISTLEKG